MKTEERYPIDRIQIPESRLRRTRPPEIEKRETRKLAKSIERFSLFHPIGLREDGTLIYGLGRLEAHKKLGRTTIWAKIATTGEEEALLMERDENWCRTPTTPYEASQEWVAKVAADREEAAEEEAEEDQGVGISRGRRAKSKSNPKGAGRPKKQGSTRDLEKRSGVPGSTLRAAERHVAAGKRWPFLKGEEWSQKAAIAAAKTLEELPAKDALRASNLVSQVGVEPVKGIRILKNLARREQEERDKLLQAAASSDARDRTTAKRILAELPAAVDERVFVLEAAIDDLVKAAKMYPGDSLNDRIRGCAKECRSIIKEMQSFDRQRQKEFS